MASANSVCPSQGLAGTLPSSSKPPGFSKRERRFLALALAGILLWGFTDVDRTVLDEPGSPPSVNLRRPPVSSTVVGSGVYTLADRGAEVFEANGCYACHSIDGSKKIGPSLLSSWGRSKLMADGSTRIVDEEYFYESILEPQAHVVAGFEEAAMPSYEGLISSDDLEALVQYVRSLK